jgi:hypothetical protein
VSEARERGEHAKERGGARRLGGQRVQQFEHRPRGRPGSRT